MKKAGTKQMLTERKGWFVGTSDVKPSACKYGGGKCSTDPFAEPYYCCPGELFSGVELVVCRLLNPLNPGRAGGRVQQQPTTAPTGPRSSGPQSLCTLRMLQAEFMPARVPPPPPAVAQCLPSCAQCALLLCAGNRVSCVQGRCINDLVSCRSSMHGCCTSPPEQRRASARASCSAATHTTHHSHASCAVQG
jgi:hypothetical protein